MMYRFSKIIIAATLILQACWLLPWCYSFCFSSSSFTPFTLYSPVVGDFVSMTYDEKPGYMSKDMAGNYYTESQTDSIMPFFYVRQLVSDERFPDSIKGVPVTPHQVRMSNIIFRTNASDINKPIIGLYPLLESKSKRVDLVMSEDVFRTTPQGMEFIVMNTNQIDEAKSKLFTETMKNKGFAFPAQLVVGNPNTQKEYDEGYLMLDAEGKLFHLKRICNRPFVRAISLPEGIRVKHMFITEFNSRATLGYLFDENNQMYVLRSGSYEIVKTGIPSLNPAQQSFMIIGNMMTWTVRVSAEDSEDFYALDAEDYHLIKKTSFPSRSTGFSILSFTSYKDKFIKARFFE